MNILVVGSGGREHALCWAIAASPIVENLFCIPGNAGIAECADCIDLEPENICGILSFCGTHNIDLVVVGPEVPLVKGLADLLIKNNVRVFGPTKSAAALEGSKSYTKKLCEKYSIPTAKYKCFHDSNSAKKYVEKQDLPIVIKADGLAAGKGVIIAETRGSATAAIDEIFAGRFGDAGSSIVVEEYLEGEEASFFVLCDGENILPLASAQDHKRVGDGDVGPNTGGMGAYSPAPIIDDVMEDRIIKTIIRPTIQAMKAEGAPYTGVLYAGLMISCGIPKLIEYNVRFGDPECQVLMTRLNSDIVPALVATCDGKLDKIELCWKNEAALVVIMAAKGYPGKYDKGDIIRGLATAENRGALVFHSGTLRDGNHIRSAGGRVIGVTTLGKDIKTAQTKAYNAIDAIDWPEGFCRRDIGWRVSQQ